MTKIPGFWSYVHADDEADGQRIARLARDVSAQFEMLTGETLDLFVDKEAIRWGEEWRAKIDASLGTVAFFIPVLTPRYFMNAECRRELQFFARESSRLGISELLLPVLYVDVITLHDENATDDLVKLIRTFQWEDWRELRYAELTAESYRRGVARLAGRLVEANRHVEKSNALQVVPIPDFERESSPDDEPGFLDQMATAEDTMPKLVQTIEAIGREIETIGQVMRQGTAELEHGDKQAAGFAARIMVARKVARLLTEPVEKIWSFGNEFASQFHEIDQGMRLILERVPGELKENPSNKETVCDFFDAVREMAAKTNTGLQAVQGMIDAIGPIEKMSRDLRPVLRQLRAGLTAMVEAREVSDEWVHLIDRTGIECQSPAAQQRDGAVGA